jgi:hypothetical protein
MTSCVMGSPVAKVSRVQHAQDDVRGGARQSAFEEGGVRGSRAKNADAMRRMREHSRSLTIARQAVALQKTVLP